MLLCQSYIVDQKRKTNTSEKKKMKTRCGIASRKDFSARAERASEREDHTLRTKPQTGKKPAKHL